MTDKNQDSTGYSPIQCQLYDYIEIACMRHYQLEITLSDGNTMTAQAQTTRIKDKQEWLVVKVSSDSSTRNDNEDNEDNEDNQLQEIRLDLIKSIEPLDENAEFKKVEIS